MEEKIMNYLERNFIFTKNPNDYIVKSTLIDELIIYLNLSKDITTRRRLSTILTNVLERYTFVLEKNTRIRSKKFAGRVLINIKRKD